MNDPREMPVVMPTAPATAKAAAVSREHVLACVERYSRDMVSLHGPDGRILYVAPSCRTLLGYEPEEMLDRKASEFRAEASLGTTFDDDFQRRTDGEAMESVLFRARCKDGTTIWLESAVQRIDGEGGAQFVVSSRDVSARIRAEKALLGSEAKFRNLVETSSDLVWETNAAGNFTYCSPQCEAILGYRPEEMVGRPVFDFMPPPEAARAAVLSRELASRRLPFVQVRNLNLHRDGREVMLETSGLPVVDGRGRLLGYRGIDRDVTANWRVEERLRESEERHRALLDDAVDLIGTIGLDGRVLEVNRACERLLGYRPEELVGVELEVMHANRHSRRLLDAFRVCVERGEAEYLDGTLRCKDGRVLPVDIRGTLIGFGGQKVVQVIVRDATRWRDRERIRVAEEVAHRDLLLREVHHRIKNNLQGVAGILRHFADDRPDLGAPMAVAIAKVQSIAAVYGLQGRAGINCRLLDMLFEVVSVTESIWQARFDRGLEGCTIERCGVTVAEGEAVPLSLVLNELLANAVKHRVDGDDGDGGALALRAHCGTRAVRLEIRNRGCLPAGFDFGTQAGVGTGLRLVHSLLPRRGARIEWQQRGDEVVAVLELETPVVCWRKTAETCT